MPRIFPVAAFAVMVAAPALAADWSPLMTAEEVAAAGPVALIDIRAEGAGGFAAPAAHAPFALWRGPEANPGETPDAATLTATMQAAGIDAGERVAILHSGEDATAFAEAARVYWTLKSAGIAEVAIVRDGLRGWRAAGLPVSDAPAAPATGDAVAILDEDRRADWDAVEAAATGGAALLDARPDAFLSGELLHPAAATGGTIPGAAQLNYEIFFENARDFAPEAEDLAAARALIGDEGGAIVFCNTGVWAAAVWFALAEVGGFEDVRLYDEGVVGWTGFGGETVKIGAGTVVN